MPATFTLRLVSDSSENLKLHQVSGIVLFQEWTTQVKCLRRGTPKVRNDKRAIRGFFYLALITICSIDIVIIYIGKCAVGCCLNLVLK